MSSTSCYNVDSIIDRKRVTLLNRPYEHLFSGIKDNKKQHKDPQFSEAGQHFDYLSFVPLITRNPTIELMDHNLLCFDTNGFDLFIGHHLYLMMQSEQIFPFH